MSIFKGLLGNWAGGLFGAAIPVPVPDVPPPEGGIRFGNHAVIDRLNGGQWERVGDRLWRDGAWRDATSLGLNPSAGPEA